MAKNPLNKKQVLPGCISICLLLVTSSAMGIYDKAPADLIDEALAQQDVISIEIGASREQFAPQLTAKDLLIYKLIRNLQNLQTEPRQYYERTSFNHLQRDRLPKFAYKTEKEKRLSDMLKGSTSARFRPQQKWKTKKGKVIGKRSFSFKGASVHNGPCTTSEKDAVM